jgi:hypothetical protein
MLRFLGWSAPDEDSFASDVRIVLVSEGFSKELTTAVLWLNSRDIGHQWGCLALTGWCVSRRGKIPIPNPEKNPEPTVDSGSTPLGALRGWVTPTAAPCHWLEHRLHKPGVAKPADDRGTPTHPS